MEKMSRDYFRHAGTGRRTKAHLVFGLFCLSIMVAGIVIFLRSR